MSKQEINYYPPRLMLRWLHKSGLRRISSWDIFDAKGIKFLRESFPDLFGDRSQFNTHGDGGCAGRENDDNWYFSLLIDLHRAKYYTTTIWQRDNTK